MTCPVRIPDEFEIYERRFNRCFNNKKNKYGSVFFRTDLPLFQSPHYHRAPPYCPTLSYFVETHDHFLRIGNKTVQSVHNTSLKVN
jgi:hypothetical protein